MYVFGHAGLTIAAARAVDRDTDPRWAAVLALSPDILDKPLAFLCPALTHYNTRSLGHSLVFSAFVLAALLLWKRRLKPAIVLWGCYLGHLLLDGMWRKDNPEILLWPLFGGFPPSTHGPWLSWYMACMILGEIAGLVVIIKLAQRHGLTDRPHLIAFLKTGRLA